MEIVPLTPQNRREINRPNQPFPLIGRLRPRYETAIFWYLFL